MHYLDHTQTCVGYVPHLLLETQHRARPGHTCTLTHLFCRASHCVKHTHTFTCCISWILPSQNPLSVFSCTPRRSEFACIPMMCCQKLCSSYTEPCMAANTPNIPVWQHSPEGCVSRRDVMERVTHTARLEYSSTPHTDSKSGKQCRRERKRKTCICRTWRFAGLKYSHSAECSVYRQSRKKYSKIYACAYWLWPSV